MDIITDYAGRKARAMDMGGYINSQRDPKKRPDIERLHSELTQCASYLVFNEYYTVDQLKLIKAHTCKKHLLCPFCAMRRSIKYVKKNTPKIHQVLTDNPSLIPVMITLTIKNTPDLASGFNALRRAEKRLKQSGRDAAKGKGVSEYAKVKGSLAAYEFTKKDEGDWHPHIHILALADSYIDQKALSDQWLALTGDSFIVDIRKIRGILNSGGLDIASAMMEVCKYSLKFHDMTLEDTWTAYNVLRGKRLVNPSGLLRGVEMPDDLLDDPLEGLPFIERHYRFHYHNRAYDLVQIRNDSGHGPSESAG